MIFEVFIQHNIRIINFKIEIQKVSLNYFLISAWNQENPQLTLNYF